jgi:hypothetical protein
LQNEEGLALAITVGFGTTVNEPDAVAVHPGALAPTTE